MLDGYIFFLNDTATTEIYTLSLHGALPILVDLLLPQCRGSSRGHCFLRGPGPVGALRLHLLPHAHDSRDHRHRRRRRTHRRSEEHTSELQSRQYLVCRLLLEKKIASLTIST